MTTPLKTILEVWASWTVVLILATRLPAQTNAPVRLALIAENDEASAASDVLTAQLSGNPNLQLLERNEIEKVYREQGLSAGNKDYLKLGQVLGADGLLLLDAVEMPKPSFFALPGGFKTPSSFDINVQLIAVKPGVVLANGQFPLSGDISRWAVDMANHLNPLLQKLSVSAQDAVPISIVNFRSAVHSAETEDEERQLTSLAIQRLSRERRLFVLERRNMQLLAGEKEFKGPDESAFWNGSYLLEGTLDRGGYAKDTLTVSARLRPPKGGAPLEIEVSGSRTNLPEVIHQLTDKVLERLKLNPAAAPWNPADEAQQYFDEAQWALKWKAYPEAQMAAESAWALGKHDLESASLRIRAYVDEIPTVIPSNIKYYARGRKTNYVHFDEKPDSKNLERALYVLELYRAFGRTSPDGEPKVLSRDPGLNQWRISDWYQLGIKTLTTASQILQHFHFHPESQTPVADKLAELRALSRSVAELISKSPSVHDSYFVGEPRYTMQATNIFSCEASFGCLWQERPEDAIELYRKLMASPAFGFLQESVWFRKSQPPRVIAWSDDDQKRIPALWDKFMAELNGSTNLFLRMEPMAIAVVDAKNNGELEAAHRRLFSYVITNYEAILTQNPDLLTVPWTPGHFFGGDGTVVPVREKLEQQYKEEYAPRLSALQDEFVRRREADRQELENRRSFEEQKRYLVAMTPYDFQQFIRKFAFHDYSREQAAELKPLLVAYRSNLLARAPTGDNWKLFLAQSDAQAVEFHVERRLDAALNAPSTSETPKAARVVPQPATVKKNAATTVEATNKAVVPQTEEPADMLFARRFFAIPLDQLPATNLSNIAILNHHAHEGILLLDLRYRDSWWERGTNFARQRTVYREAAAVLHPDGSWEVIPYPHSEDSPVGAGDFLLAAVGGPAPKLYSELLNGAIYVSDLDAIRKYDFKTRLWTELPFPQQERPQLFTANDRLYAANAETMVEISDDERGFRVLASTRRRPAVSMLDTLSSLGAPVLFSGSNHSLCTCLGDKTFRWDGSDWCEQFALNGVQMVEPFPDAVIFRSRPPVGLANLWLWKKDQSAPELCLEDEEMRGSNIGNTPVRHTPDSRAVKPRWQSPEGCHLTMCAATYFNSKLFFLVGDITTAGNDQRAKLVCLDPDFTVPVVVPLKFDAPSDGLMMMGLHKQPDRRFGGARSVWMCIIGKELYFGQSEVPGIWALSLSEVENAIVVKRQIQTGTVRHARVDNTNHGDESRIIQIKTGNLN